MPQKTKSPGSLTLACLIWLMLAAQVLGAQTPPLITLDDAGTSSVDLRFLLYTDNRNETIQEILKKDQQAAFVSPQSGIMNTGYSTATYWMKLRIQNPTQEKDWYLAAEIPHIQLDAFRVLPDQKVEASRESDVTHQREVVPLSIEPGAEALYFVRLRSPYIADLHLKIVNREQLHQRKDQQLIFVSLLAGCLTAMIVYNFFLFLSLRDRNYFYYLIFALVNSHLNLWAVRFPDNIDRWFGWNWWPIMPYYVPMAPLVTFIFARSFLQTRQQSPGLDKVLLAYMGGLGLSIVAAFFTEPPAQMNFLSFYMLLGIVLLLYAGLRSLWNGFPPARYFLAAIGTFLIGILILLMRSVGFLPANFFTNNVHLFAQAAEMLLMSLALGSRIKLLEVAKARAEVTSDIKTRLLRIISHDIVTPLTVVKATAYQLKREVSDPARVERVVRAASIIEDIVGFIRKKETMESGETMELGAVALKSVFDELAFLFHDRALEKEIVLNFELEDTQLAVQAEPVSLSNEVLGNLISNAIKFSQPGSKVLIHATRAKQGRVVITIRDHGIGMNAGTLSKLFDPAAKQSRQGTRGERGIGFGMPLAKAYVDAYGGLIEVISLPTEQDAAKAGTTVRIILDAASAIPEALP